MRILIPTSRYRRDLKRVSKRGKNLEKLAGLLRLLELDATLPISARPHALHGEWAGYLECHIESDWLLVYRIADDAVELAGTGTHADLFE